MPDEKKRTRNYDKSPEGIAYRRSYNKDHYTVIRAYVKPELNDRIEADAQRENISKTQVIVNAITAYLDEKEKDG